MPGIDGITHFSTGTASTSLRFVLTAALTRTMPSTSVGWSAASRSTREPPIDSPPTTTWSFSAFSLSNARLTSAYQSAHVVLFIACQVVP